MFIINIISSAATLLIYGRPSVLKFNIKFIFIMAFIIVGGGNVFNILNTHSK